MPSKQNQPPNKKEDVAVVDLAAAEAATAKRSNDGLAVNEKTDKITLLSPCHK